MYIYIEMLNLEELRHTDSFRGLDLSDVEVQQEFYASRDGTLVSLLFMSSLFVLFKYFT